MTETSTDVGRVGGYANIVRRFVTTRSWVERANRRPRATPARARRLVEASAKCLGEWEATETLKPATRPGRRSTLWEWVSGARQQVAPEAGGPVPVNCSACRAGWGHGMSGNQTVLVRRNEKTTHNRHCCAVDA